MKKTLYILDLNLPPQNSFLNLRFGISSDLEGRFYRSQISYYKTLEKILAFNENPKEVVYQRLVALFRNFTKNENVIETVPRRKNNPDGNRTFRQIKPEVSARFKQELQRRLWSVDLASEEVARFAEKLLIRLRYETDGAATVNFAEGLSLPEVQERWILDTVSTRRGLFNKGAFSAFIENFKVEQVSLTNSSLKQFQKIVTQVIEDTLSDKISMTANEPEYIFTEVGGEVPSARPKRVEKVMDNKEIMVRTRYSLTDFLFKNEDDKELNQAVSKWITGIDKVIEFDKYMKKASVPKELASEVTDYSSFSSFMKMAARADINRRKHYYNVLRGFMDHVNGKYFDLKLEYVAGNKNYYIPVETRDKFIKQMKIDTKAVVSEVKSVVVKPVEIKKASDNTNVETLLNLLREGKINESTALKFLEKVS